MKLKYLTGKSCLACEPEHSPVTTKLSSQYLQSFSSYCSPSPMDGRIKGGERRPIAIDGEIKAI